MERFIVAQDEMYNIALSEIKNGFKESHWIWYIFPQIYGLGHSSKAKYYELKSISEAKEYINNDILRKRLLEISEAIYLLDDDIDYILLSPDDLKFKSSMTLFYLIAPEYTIFKKNLDKFFGGELCEHTKDIYIKETMRKEG